MDKRRVLLITNFKPGTGGISGQVELLYKYLSLEGVCVSIFNTKGTVLYRLFVIIKLLLDGNRFSVFHIHGCSGWGFFPIVVGVIAGKILRKRIIVTYHGGDAAAFFATHPKLVKLFLLRTNQNIVLSGFLGEVFDTHKIPYTIIPNIIELKQDVFIQRERIRPKFISIRTLSQLYNIDCIIKAFYIVKKQIPEAQLCIVGDGPQREELEILVKDLNINDVVFYGRVKNDEIYKYLNESDIMISAPRIDNMPVSLLEAFNAGLLVISSNVGGVPYMIENGENGLLFESMNVDALAEQMIYAIKNQSSSISMIEEAKKRLEMYSWPQIMPHLYKIYNW